MEKKEAVKDASSLYEVERRAYYGQRPGFRIGELQISPTQKVPWHFHNRIDDTFYVLAGRSVCFCASLTKTYDLHPATAIASRQVVHIS